MLGFCLRRAFQKYSYWCTTFNESFAGVRSIGLRGGWSSPDRSNLIRIMPVQGVWE